MKLSNMIMIIAGLQILLWLAGINNSVGYILGQLNVTTNPTGITDTFLFTQIALILTAAATVGIIAGFITKSPTENLLIIPLIAFFINFAGDWFSLISLTNGYCEAFTAPISSCAWITWIVVGIIVPLGIGFAMACVDWWRGRE